MSSVSQESIDLDVSAVDLMEQPDDRTGFDEYEEFVEVERYWVYRPYAYISIIFSEREQTHIYFAIEPELSEYGEILKREFSDRLRDRLMYEDISVKADQIGSRDSAEEIILLENAMEIAAEYGVGVEDSVLQSVLYYIERDYIYYGKIEPIVRDPYIEDIHGNGYDVPIYVYHQDLENIRTNIVYSDDDVNEFVIRMAQRSGEHISKAQPLVEASLPTGARAHLSLGEDITTRGSTFTVRKYGESKFTPIDLIKSGTFSVNQMAYLWMAIENEMSLIFAGDTGSGKTTSMNAVSLFIPPGKKVVSIEDTRELTIPHENWVPEVTRTGFSVGSGSASSEIEMMDLLRTALRQRPEYLLVGEVRGEEANTMFQAMATGHTTYTTFHAEDINNVISRLRSEPIEVADVMLKSLDIVSVQGQELVDGERVRRNKTIHEISAVDPNAEEEPVEYLRYFDRIPQEDEWNEIQRRSHVLGEIAEKRGWSYQRVEEERQKRREVLEYLSENDITGFREVARILQMFMINDRRVLDAIEDESLDPVEYADMKAII